MADTMDADGTLGVDAGRLLPQVYEELRAMARQRLADERAGHTLQATALVHEAYLRLSDGQPDGQRFANRAHFFAAAAESMRRVLVEHARSRGREKRGGAATRLAWSSVLDLAALPASEEILAFDDALRRMEEQMPAAAAVVRLRFFTGLTVEETADTLGVSPRSVNREWTYARAWLFQLLDGDR